jgi:hypothetical protein
MPKEKLSLSETDAMSHFLVALQNWIVERMVGVGLSHELAFNTLSR